MPGTSTLRPGSCTVARIVRAFGACAIGVGALGACASDAERPGAPGSPSRLAQSAVPADGRRLAIDSLQRLGDSTYRRSADSAGRLWNRALIEARALGDSIRIARALTGLGQAARQLGRFTEARRLGEEALALKRRHGMTEELFRSYNALGLLAWGEGRLGEASRLLAAAAEAARATDDRVSLAKAMVNSGLVASDLAAFTAARRAYASAGDAARSLGDSVTLARALNNLGALEVKMGDPVAAVASLAEARRIALAIGDSVVELNARGQLALAYEGLGEPQRAFALLDSALAMARRAGRRQEAAENLKLMADLYRAAGSHQHALDHYRRARIATEALGQPEELGNVLREEAVAHASLGNLPLATERARSALALHRRAGLAYAEARDRLVLASFARRRGRFAEAEAELRTARATAARLDAPALALQTLLAEAELAADRGQWRAALAVLQHAGTRLEVASDRERAQVLALRARALEQLRQVDAAVAAGREAVSTLERVRARYGSGELRTTFASERVEVYTGQVLRLLRAGRTEEAFEVADRARGRSLLDHLGASRTAIVQSAATGLRDQEALLRRIDALVAQLRLDESTPPRERAASASATASELRDSLGAARAEYEALLARRGGATPERRMAGAAPTSAREVIASLHPGEALLEYLVTPDALLVFVVTGAGVTVRMVPERADNLAARVQLARELLRRRDREEAAQGVLRALHPLLLGPLREATTQGRPIERLIVVPHGALVYLPFAALVDPASGRYLMQDVSLLHLPTSGALPALRGSPGAIASVAATEVFAPFPDSLRGTADEAREVARARRSARLHVGPRASEAQVRAALGSGGVVHIATHARMNGRNPLFSQIALAGTPGAHTGDNGRLEVHELLDLRVPSPLVFLSGCETALGGAWATRFDTGEDFTTIAQAFLHAGARNVVATLWRIDDAGAAAFATRFYAATGMPYPEALAYAQRSLLGDARFRSPYFWAAYQLTGDGGAAGADRRPRAATRDHGPTTPAQRALAGSRETATGGT